MLFGWRLNSSRRSRRPDRGRQRRGGFKPLLEALEDRAVPSATHFLLIANDPGSPPSIQAGTTASVTVKAVDDTNTVDPTYTGTIHFISSDAAPPPADYPFVVGDAGVHTFTVPFQTAGSQNLTATGTGLTGTTNTLTYTITPAALDHFALTPSAGSVTAGTGPTLTVIAKDVYNNTITSYAGTVALTSSDTAAVLPGSHTFVAGDNGQFIFNGITLKTAGPQTLIATDNGVSPAVSNSTSVTVNPAALDHFALTPSSGSVTAGTGLNLTVTAKDVYNNTITSYAGTVALTSSDTAATLPGNHTFVAGSSGDNGQFVFTGITLNTAGSQTLIATDNGASPAITSNTSVTVVAYVPPPPPPPPPAPPAADPNAGFVNSLYLSLLGRPADPGGSAGWLAALAGGVSRSQVALGIMGSPEYEANEIQGLYQSLLGRPADPGGLANFQNLLSMGFGYETVKASLLSSPEFVLVHSGGGNAGLLEALYVSILGRDVDPGGLASFGNYLAKGGSVAGVVFALLYSPEGAAVRVAQLYQQYLHRAPDAGGAAAFTNALLSGWTDEMVAAALMGSPEFSP